MLEQNTFFTRPAKEMCGLCCTTVVLKMLGPQAEFKELFSKEAFLA
jgi:hypothetical protein